MTTSAAPTLKDKELVSCGLVESASVNSFADFTPSKLNQSQVSGEKQREKNNNDFINTFICHLIFYSFFCVSLLLYILIDLEVGSLIKRSFVKLWGIEKKPVLMKRTAFA